MCIRPVPDTRPKRLRASSGKPAPKSSNPGVNRTDEYADAPLAGQVRKLRHTFALCHDVAVTIASLAWSAGR
jgi:hypothetical protein